MRTVPASMVLDEVLHFYVVTDLLLLRTHFTPGPNLFTANTRLSCCGTGRPLIIIAITRSPLFCNYLRETPTVLLFSTAKALPPSGQPSLGH
jgi:hypothetical protein